MGRGNFPVFGKHVVLNTKQSEGHCVRNLLALCDQAFLSIQTRQNFPDFC